MFIHWSHHYLPKVFGILSFVFNPLFIYLALNDNKSSIGQYRYLLIGFAVFDMIYSAVELTVPVAIDGTGAAFVIYITDGPFYNSSNWGQLAISVRCGFISLSYGILAIHFIYRYCVLFNVHLMNKLLHPTGLLTLFLYFLLHGILWTLSCEYLLYGDQEVKDYIRPSFETAYGVDSHNLVLLMSLYYDASAEIRRRSWLGILILTAISVYAIALYVILGFKIVKKLSVNTGVSAATQQLQRQLFKALAAQTFIPIVISFAPCMAAWYAPALGVDLGMWNNYLGVIALSAFPVLDPLAIIILLPNYRQKVCMASKNRRTVTSSGSSGIVRY